MNVRDAFTYTRSWVNIYEVADQYRVTVQWTGTRLSITATLYDAKGRDVAGGQHRDPLALIAEAYDSADARDLDAIWQQWHLNDLRAGCEHQRAAKWDEQPINPNLPLDAYITYPNGHHGRNMWVWVPYVPELQPEGLLSKPCDVCGYAYGSAWLHEDVPDDVLIRLREIGGIAVG